MIGKDAGFALLEGVSGERRLFPSFCRVLRLRSPFFCVTPTEAVPYLVRYFTGEEAGRLAAGR